MEIQSPVFCGVKQFLKRDGRRYIVSLYKTGQYPGELRGSGDGDVSWVPISDFNRHTWVPDFADMLSVLLNDKIGELYYYWENGESKHEFFEQEREWFWMPEA